jgi:XapX domain-containing protein
MRGGVPAVQRFKIGLGLLLGLAIGAACRLLDIPSPAPPVLAGAGLVVAMTLGYSLADWWLGGETAQHRENCGGPDGSLRNSSDKGTQ